jgi:hypothetical protein
MLTKPGRESYKIVVLDGFTEITHSQVKNITVIDTGNYHGYGAQDLPN